MTKLHIVGSKDIREPPAQVEPKRGRAQKPAPAAAEAERLPPPVDLDARAQRLWREIVLSAPHLEDADRFQLRQYVDAYIDYQDARDKVNQVGAVIKSPNGYPVYNPFKSQMDNDRSMCARIATELGLTFGARTRAKLKPGKARKNLSAFSDLKDFTSV